MIESSGVLWLRLPRRSHLGTGLSPYRQHDEVPGLLAALAVRRGGRDTAWAMSEENEALVVRLLDAWHRRDYAAAQSGFSPDVEVQLAIEAPNDGTYRGYEGLAEVLKFWGAFAEFRSDIEEIRSTGDRVFIEAHHHARGKTSGVDVEMTNWQVFTMRSGAIVRYAMYASRDAALEAAGLSE